MSAFGFYRVSGFSWQYHSTEFIIVSLLYTLFFCLETGVIEEVIFRGVLLNIFYKKYNLTIGVLISSVLFAILHFSGFNEQFPWWLSILSSLLVALVFVQAYLLFNNLWLPIGMHSGWHLAMRLLGSPGLDSDSAVFLSTQVDGPALLVSTKAGGAGIFELIGLLIVALVLFIIYIFQLKSKKD